MHKVALATAACLLLISTAVAKDRDKGPARVVEGEYLVAKCDMRAAEHYGPDGRKITVKIEDGEVVFRGMKEAAFGKIPRFKLEDGHLKFKNGRYGDAGNLMIMDVVSDENGDTIKVHACYIGNFELRRVSPKKMAGE